MALLVCLCELLQEKGTRVFAVHVNHGLRESAASDEAFCEELCRKLAVPLICSSVHIHGKNNVEAKARAARYAAFHEAMERVSANALALAHHADDQAETVVMHLLYGAGAAGLGGMHEYHNGVWRPFLKLRRAELHDCLKALGMTWREDESNADIIYTRNRIRAQVIPRMEKIAPEAVRTIGKTAEIMRSEDDYLNVLADEWLKENASDSQFPFILTEPLRNQHTALQRRIIRRYAGNYGVELDFQQTERVRSLLDQTAGAVENLPQGGQVLRTKTRLHFLNGKACQVTMGTLLVDEVPDTAHPLLMQPLPEDQLQNLQLRTRQKGDYIQPFGMQGKKPLKEYMIDHGIDRPFRDAWPLICRGQEVLWVIGIGASEKLRVNENTAPEHKLIFSGYLPDHV